jgi:serine kinase of HPr protein (carbohydrate metabolism regulator)
MNNVIVLNKRCKAKIKDLTEIHGYMVIDISTKSPIESFRKFSTINHENEHELDSCSNEIVLLQGLINEGQKLLILVSNKQNWIANHIRESLHQ